MSERLLTLRIVREGLPSLLLSGAGGLVAGSILPGYLAYVELLPGVLVMLPAMMNVRGAVESALAARLGTAYHLGLVHPRWGFNEEVRQNYVGSLVLALVVAVASAFFAYVVSFVFGLQSISLAALLLLALLTGAVSAFVNGGLTLFLVFWAVRRHLDPDNIVIPTVTTLGDIFIVLFAYFTVVVFVLLGIR